MSDNMQIWNAVEQTDPAYTKKVNQRGGFTAIDPMYNFRRATELFGPVGKGWWYTIQDSGIDGDGKEAIHWVLVSVQYSIQDPSIDPPKAGIHSEPVLAYGCTSMYSGQKLDEDCRKKSLTDAISKALSMLGFSSDVYLGRFDNNKYVQDLKANPPGSPEPVQKQSIVQAAKESGVLRPASEVPTPEEPLGTDLALKLIEALNEKGLDIKALRRAMIRAKIPAKSIPEDEVHTWPASLRPKIKAWIDRCAPKEQENVTEQ